jgi:hypothetical protein
MRGDGRCEGVGIQSVVFHSGPSLRSMSLLCFITLTYQDCQLLAVGKADGNLILHPSQHEHAEEFACLAKHVRVDVALCVCWCVGGGGVRGE